MTRLAALAVLAAIVMLLATPIGGHAENPPAAGRDLHRLDGVYDMDIVCGAQVAWGIKFPMRDGVFGGWLMAADSIQIVGKIAPDGTVTGDAFGGLVHGPFNGSVVDWDGGLAEGMANMDGVINCHGKWQLHRRQTKSK